jgi:hypothetical protein
VIDNRSSVRMIECEADMISIRHKVKYNFEETDSRSRSGLERGGSDLATIRLEKVYEE